MTDREKASNVLFMTTTEQVSIASRRLIAYADLDEAFEGEGQPFTANRPQLRKLLDDLRLAIAAEDIEDER